MSDSHRTPTSVHRPRPLPGLLVAALAVLVPPTGLDAQDEAETGEPTNEPTITAYHPLTGSLLVADEFYPVLRGLAYGPLPSKIPYVLIVARDRTEREEPTVEDLLDPPPMGDLSTRFQASWGDQVAEAYHEIGPGDPDTDYWKVEGEIELPFAVFSNMIIDLYAILNRGDQPIDTFYTQVRAGFPELRIRSTIISDNMMGQGLKITSVVSGTTGLEFAPDYLTLSGRGRLDYETFEIIHPQRTCDIHTEKEGGAFRAVEVVLFQDSLPAPVLPPEVGQDVSLDELVLFIEPGIKESAVVSCIGSPITMPLPSLIHFFAGFYSIHGGEVEGEPSEVDEGRGGFVIGGWTPGEGDVIATRRYSREGPYGPATIREETILEMRWRE